MLQNATSLRKSAPWPPNISDEHVSCTAPATENASLQVLFKCPTPAIVFGHATKPSRFAHFWQGAQSLAPATRNEIWTSKSAPYPSVFCTFDLEMCFAPQRRALFRHLNFQKWSENGVFCIVLYILTSKCASRHNGVHFFDISTSKSGPNVKCFVHVDFEMCFVPQRRALFRHLHSQKWSEHGVLCAFWLGNVLRALMACNFSSLIWPAGSAPAALASLLFDPPEPQIIEKTQCFATFLPFRASASSFFWLFLLSDVLSSTLLFSLPLPISAFHLSMLSEVWLLNFLRLRWTETILDQRPAIPIQSSEQKWRNQFEILLGNGWVLHKVLKLYLPTHSRICLQRPRDMILDPPFLQNRLNQNEKPNLI